MEILDNKAVVLRLRNPQKITTIIPKSKKLSDNKVAVHWGVEETRVLRNLNIKVPSPIMGQYDWTGQHAPFDHQKETAAFLTLNKRAFCFNEMGTGKTASAIWAADFLMKRKQVNRALVVCPLSIMDVAWRADLFKFAMHRSVDIAHGPASKRKDLINRGSDFVIINFDGVAVVADEIAKGGFDMVIVDECFVAGTPVLTPSGYQPIESLRSGDPILTSSGVQPIKRLIRKTSQQLIRVSLHNGQHIDCTPEHPFFTDQGWVCAKNLTGRRLVCEDELRGMRRRVLDADKQMDVAPQEGYKHGADLLQILRTEEVAFAESGGELLQSYATGTTGGPAYVQTHAGNTGQNIHVSENNRTQTPSTQRQWDGDDTKRENYSELPTSTLGMELPDSVGEKAARLSYKLQSRFCQPSNESSTGNRWGQPSRRSPQETRQEKRTEAAGTWVESVTYLERGGTTSVFNVEVEGTPNYFIGGGILVHNCTAYKNPRTDRWKVLNNLIGPNTWLWMMTGTPAAQSPMDAYGIAKMVNPKSVPRFANTFKEQVMTRVTQFKWIPRPTAVDTVHNVLQPAIRYTKEECLDLPDMIYTKRDVAMTKQQEKYYRILKNQMAMAAAGEIVTAHNAAISLTKLLQISAGAVYTDDGEVLEFDIKHRYKVLQEVIDESIKKTLVFVPFKHAINLLRERLTSDGYTVEVIQGDVPSSKRNDIFRRFQDTNSPQVLLVQPQAAAHGVTLTAANTVVWWGPVASLETYAQANARVHRSGQDTKCTVVQLQGSFAERHVYKLLDNKIDIHSKIVELYNEILD